MLTLPSLGEMDRGMAGRIFLCVTPADMRKGFDSLAALVRDYRMRPAKHRCWAGAHNSALSTGRPLGSTCTSVDKGSLRRRQST